MKKTVLLINGPNLNLLGTREPEIYGSTTLEDIEQQLRNDLESRKINLISFQSNHEGAIIDFLHENRAANYIIINAGALTHTSVGLRDAIAGINVPFVEVHISNVFAREDFRHHSYLSDLASGIIVGCGTSGYSLAARLVAERLGG